MDEEARRSGELVSVERRQCSNQVSLGRHYLGKSRKSTHKDRYAQHGGKQGISTIFSSILPRPTETNFRKTGSNIGATLHHEDGSVRESSDQVPTLMSRNVTHPKRVELSGLNVLSQSAARQASDGDVTDRMSRTKEKKVEPALQLSGMAMPLHRLSKDEISVDIPMKRALSRVPPKIVESDKKDMNTQNSIQARRVSYVSSSLTSSQEYKELQN